MTIATTTEGWLKTMAAESVRHGENLRSTVRDLTLKAMESRELTVARIEEVVRSVTEGVSLGSESVRGRTEKILADALAGMDEAVLKAAQASHIALARITEEGDFDQSQLKRALDDLERMEDSFFGAVRDASSSASAKVREQWGALITRAEAAGSGVGVEAAASLEEYGKRMRDTMRESRAATLKTAHQLSQNFATLASGVLIGLTEGLRQPPAKEPAPSGGARAPTKAAVTRKSSARPAAKRAKR
jgi:hypothetical protein